MIDHDYYERFVGFANLIGDGSLEVLRHAPITIVGLGGVGSWTAEALVRSGCSRITLVDYDHVALGNTNRQLHALYGSYGQSKVSSMTERLKKINPAVKVREVDDFLTPDNIQHMLDKGSAVIDACDQIPSKIAMAQWAVDNASAYVMCGSAGGKKDPSLLRITRLISATHDILLKKTRRALRKLGQQYDGLLVVSSSEPKQRLHRLVSGNGISCTGLGSCVTVTATMGLFAAHAIIDQLIK